MPRQKTTQTLKAQDTLKEQIRGIRERARMLYAWQKVTIDLHGETRDEFRDALLHFLVHTPDTRQALTLLKFLRKNHDKGRLRDLLALVPRPGRQKGHTWDFWTEAHSFFWAHEVCKLSQKETLFYSGKIRSLGDDLTRNQRRDFKNRIEAARQGVEEEIPTWKPFILALHPMSKEERKAWAIKLLQKVFPTR